MKGKCIAWEKYCARERELTWVSVQIIISLIGAHIHILDKISFSRDISLFEDVFGPEKDLNVEKSHILGHLRISHCTVSCLQLRIAIIRRSLSLRLLRESKSSA